jgi:hypothetical protein
MPFRVIPDLGQVSEYGAHPSIKQRCDVFHDDEARSYLANEARELSPETGPLACNASLRAGVADVLAGEAATDDIDSWGISGKLVCIEGSYVIPDWHVGPMLLEDCAAVGIDFTETDGLHPGSLKPETKTADS